jgi:LPS-assembly lipoprotein
MSLFSKMFAVLTVLAVGGCGFQPLYQKHTASDAVVDDLAQIEVLNPIEKINHDDRLGQKVKNLLLDRLNPFGRPQAAFYTLAVTVQATKTELGIKINDEATRAKLSLTASFILVEKKTKAELFQGRSRSVNSYNIVNSDFATLSAENNAKDRAARELSDDIKIRLGIFFNELRSGT